MKLIKRCRECELSDALINWDTNPYSRVRLIFNIGQRVIYFRIRGPGTEAKPRIIFEVQ